MPPETIRVVVAGAGFAALREHLAQASGRIEIEAVEPARLRTDGTDASVLIPTMARIDAEMMDRIRGLRLIQQWGAGLEGVDLAAASGRRIAVANVPSAGTGNAASVAEWCVMAAIALSRHLRELERSIRRGGAWGGPIGRGLAGRTAGILGLGGIGEALVRRLKPFGMIVIGLTRRPDRAIAEGLGLDWICGVPDLQTFLARSEYLFLCVPLQPETHHIIGAREIAFLPAGAYIINAARGGLIDTEALLDGLNSGHLAGAALDVFATEPLNPHSPLLNAPNLIATPHIAGVTDVSYCDIARRVADNIRRLWSGEPLEHRIV